MFPMKVNELAKLVNGKVIGDGDLIINRLNRIEDAIRGDVTFLYQGKYEKYFLDSTASCVLVSDDIANEPKENQSLIVCDNPYLSFISLIKHFENMRNKPVSSIHSSATIASNAEIGKFVQIGANAVISENCRIGDYSKIMPNVVLYKNVIIGENTIINSSVVCYQDIEIGNNCIIHAGAVIGADGFGFVESKEDGSYEKIPHIGNVKIKNNVEIGANATIDRALLGSTIIEDGVKIDNMVHIAHNCIIGENSGIAAQTGVSGSSKVGKRNRFGGQVGLAGHLETADDVTLIAQSGVSKSVIKPGVYFGTPIKERLHAFKIEACLRQLPELFAEFDKLKKSCSSSE